MNIRYPIYEGVYRILTDNIAALEFMFMRPEFCLTEEGRRVLNGYSGFGGLKCILNPAEKDTDIEK